MNFSHVYQPASFVQAFLLFKNILKTQNSMLHLVLGWHGENYLKKLSLSAIDFLKKIKIIKINFVFFLAES